ncbi:gem-associated protein 8-like [Pteronotus mesoamericanus]|uniref:gem-associated protein 8-like n=1 Tax=Pteronotus mesoamericanus TaxID=1884717 RepID=UPI0023EDA731|nr:gem-associated protein 8-like [Pteronotus parnellii mesoamericanus]
MAAEATSSETEEPWSCHPAYARYWHHYHQAMAWMRSHRKAYRKAMESYFRSSCRRGAQVWATEEEEEEGEEEGEEEEEEKEEEEETDSDEGVECDLSNKEITEELRQYFAETKTHREERRRRQQLDEKRLEDSVNADHDLYYKTCRSVEPPSERPGERRHAEMKCLYGDSAAKIQAREAALQLSFNKHFDRKRPKYWPVIPLKF